MVPPSAWQLAPASDANPAGAARFPYAVSLCKPCLEGGSGDTGHQLFAQVEHGTETHKVTSWPCLSLPFQLRLHGSLVIRVFAATDGYSFQTGARDDVGFAVLPLEAVPGAMCTSELSAATEAPTPTELWLRIHFTGNRVRTAAKMMETEKAKLQIARPGEPRICVLLQARHALASALCALSRVGSPLPMELLPGPWTPMGLRASDPSTGLNVEDTPEERWRKKTEAEQQKIAQLEHTYSVNLARLNSEADKLFSKLEFLMAFAAHSKMSCMVDLCFEAWGEWVRREKCECQFDQLSKDLDNFRNRRHKTLEQLSLDATCLDLKEEDQKLQNSRLRRRWFAGIARLETRIRIEVGRDMLSASFASWVSFTRIASVAAGLDRTYNSIWNRELLRVPLAAWRSMLGADAADAVLASYESAKKLTLQDARDISATRLEAALCCIACVRPAAEAFHAWAQLASVLSRYRSKAVHILQVSEKLKWREADVMSYCISIWHGSAFTAGSRIVAERSKRKANLEQRRRLTASVMAALGGAPGSARVSWALRCWQCVAKQRKLQELLETSFKEGQSAKANLENQNDELQSTQAEMSQEDARWELERNDLLERLQHLQAEQEEGPRKLEKVAEKRIQVEMKKAQHRMRAEELQMQIDDLFESVENEDAQAVAEIRNDLDEDEKAAREQYRLSQSSLESLERDLQQLQAQAKQQQQQQQQQRRRGSPPRGSSSPTAAPTTSTAPVARSPGGPSVSAARWAFPWR